MLFNSPEFIFFFLPIALASFFAFGHFAGFRAALVWLVALSLVFYAWWKPADLPVLVISIGANFILARFIATAKSDRRAGMLLVFGIVANLAALGWYKYAHLLAATANELLGLTLAAPNPALPLGISFFTFLQIAYLVDVRRERRADGDLAQYGLFVTFFPHLIAGPILHHMEMMPQFTAEKARFPIGDDLAVGATLFAFGLFKKLILADTAAGRANQVFEYAAAMPLTTAEAWLGAVAYGFQIYFDFSGYSDMAIGLARMFGIRLPVNFDSPYKATNIIDFWRRWHMTLSRFLRDYLYIPLGGGRSGAARRYINIMITMILGGLWHGASWTFAAWGGLHGVYLVGNHLWQRLRGQQCPARVARPGWRKIPAIASTFILVTIAWVPFRASDFAVTGNMWRSMAMLDGFALPRSIQPLEGSAWGTALTSLGVRFDGMFANQAFGDVSSGLALMLVLAFIAFALPNTQEVMSRFEPALGFRPRRDTVQWVPSLRWAILVGGTFGLALMALAHPVRFIYFTF